MPRSARTRVSVLRAPDGPYTTVDCQPRTVIVAAQNLEHDGWSGGIHGPTAAYDGAGRCASCMPPDRRAFWGSPSLVAGVQANSPRTARGFVGRGRSELLRDTDRPNLHRPALQERYGGEVVARRRRRTRPPPEDSRMSSPAAATGRGLTRDSASAASAFLAVSGPTNGRASGVLSVALSSALSTRAGSVIAVESFGSASPASGRSGGGAVFRRTAGRGGEGIVPCRRVARGRVGRWGEAEDDASSNNATSSASDAPRTASSTPFAKLRVR